MTFPSAGPSVALITGAASAAGIGFATARRLVTAGWQVALTDIDGDAVLQRATELGETAVGLRHDVAEERGWDETLQSVTTRFGRLDALVNNAGIAVLAPIEELTLAQWHKQLNVNLTSTFFGCRLAMRHFLAQGRGGAIVNVSSVAGLVGMRRTAAYAASKGGVRMMSKAIALEGAELGIRVNSVHPGVIATDIQHVARRDAGGDSDAIAAAIPLRRMGRADEVAAMIAFLVSSDASYITGAEFVVDGGLTAQ